MAKKDSNKKEASIPEGFIKEISGKIKSATTMDDLEALNQEVYDIWADQVPAEIQALAGKRAEEIEEAIEPKDDPVEKVAPKTPEKWVKCDEVKAKQAEAEGKLVGYDPKRGIALIKK